MRTGFAARFDKALLDADTTTEDFARDFGVAVRTAYRWRNGEAEPYAHKLPRIARMLGRDPAWFFEADD